MNFKTLLIAIITLLILFQYSFIYAAAPLEGFKSLKINQNLDECLKNSDFQKGNLFDLHLPTKLAVHFSSYNEMYDIIGTNTVELYKNCLKNFDLLKYEDQCNFYNIHKNISEYHISDKNTQNFCIGTMEILTLSCYTYRDNILAIQLKPYERTSNAVVYISNLLKEKYGEPNHIIKGYDVRIYGIWRNGSLVLFHTTDELIFINIDILTELVNSMLESLNKEIEIIKNRQTDIQKEQHKKALENL